MTTKEHRTYVVTKEITTIFTMRVKAADKEQAKEIADENREEDQGGFVEGDMNVSTLSVVLMEPQP